MNNVTSIVEYDAENSVQNLELPTDAVEEDFDRGLKERHIQMIAIGGAIGVGCSSARPRRSSRPVPRFCCRMRSPVW